MVLFTIVLTVLVVFCADIHKLWAHDWYTFTGSQCFSSAVYSYTAAIGDCIADLFIFTLPAPYLFSLRQICVRQRVTLISVFALGIIVCGVALVQVPFILRREQKGTYFGPAINMLVAIQISLAIVAACLPDMRALVTRALERRKSRCDVET
jgi:drug/metabolite transporter (DMT)-like permease